jgi:hypothetical protein
LLTNFEKNIEDGRLIASKRQIGGLLPPFWVVSLLRAYIHVQRGVKPPPSSPAQWFDTRTSKKILFVFLFVNEICSWDIYLTIKA